ncbi:6,7-dimethyl-8-ribityllumazine synthase [Limimonas halophila]|uniref:6,7-dimethyl-8-ribityllumazine synthase n=1 Tax=Limimonas halophila TaxID=1082479 RepID=A0A1G7NVM4_9PROT|nr:6,7-dimethyl-8-ribityllumazine synthase [Limimonas halophila]SDF78064.1 6,7-dimethyl-8-ribityllumazine synthase [Limimonas halophila]
MTAPHILIAEARYYEDVGEHLLQGAIDTIERAGATWEHVRVPGAFELPAAVQIAVRSLDFYALRRRADGYVTLGCVIRGATSHYDHVCEQTTRKLQDLACHYTLALGYGLLTCENHEQALERARTDRRNKGGEAAQACLDMIELKRAYHLYPR